MDGGLPSSKKPKISDLRHAIPFCSQSALEAICQYIAIHGLPDKHRRQDIWKETKEFLENAEMSKYGPLLHRNKGIPALNQEKVVLHINFLSLLAGVFYKGGAFTDFLKFHTAQPSSLEAPWRAVVYCDEVHPGNIEQHFQKAMVHLHFLFGIQANALQGEHVVLLSYLQVH